MFAAVGVAPRVGAWIEIICNEQTNLLYLTSHPVWVRGLKSCCGVNRFVSIASHPVWVRGLKSGRAVRKMGIGMESHPVWVRGLKSGY